MNYLDTLAVPVSGYWDLQRPAADQQQASKRMLSDLVFRGGGHSRTRGSVPIPNKRFSMNYMDFKNWQDNESNEKEKKEKLKLEKKRFTMNFQDTIQGQNGQNNGDGDGGGGGWRDTVIGVPLGGWNGGGSNRRG